MSGGHLAFVIPTDPTKAPQQVTVCGLEELQKRVGGYIQFIPVDRPDVALYCNEEGKIHGLAPNPRATAAFRRYLSEGDYLAGPVVVAGQDPDTGDLIDLPEDVQKTFRFIVEEVFA